MHTRRSKVGYTTRNLECQLPSIGIRALLFYNDAYAQFLDIEGGEMFKGCRKEVQAVWDELTALREYEQSISYAAYLQISRSADAQQMQLEISIFHSTMFFGDFLTATCKELFIETEAKKIKG